MEEYNEYNERRKMRQYRLQKEKEKDFKKMVVAVSVAGALLVSGVGGLTYFQHKNYQEETKIVQTIDLPKEITHGQDIDIEVEKNGDAYFIDNQTQQKFETYNGLSAVDLAKGYKEENTQEQNTQEQNTQKQEKTNTKEENKKSNFITFSNSKRLYEYLTDSGLDQSQIDMILSDQSTTMDKEGNITINNDLVNYWKGHAEEAKQAMTL